jgi:hypothetical protein
MNDKLAIKLPSQGWKQILTSRKEMLGRSPSEAPHAFFTFTAFNPFLPSCTS